MKKYIISKVLLLMALTPMSNINLGEINDNQISSNIKAMYNHFDYAFKSFSYYNSRMDTATVRLFIEVSKEFGFYDDTVLFETHVSQICAESGAKQFYDDSTLVISSGNAIGITQIVPNTGFLFLKNVISKNDSVLKQLGGGDYDDIVIHDKCDKIARSKTIEWLSNKRNNIIMWGYIMEYCRKKGGTTDKSLIAYNQGENFLRKFLKQKKEVKNFAYVKHVKRIRERLKNLFKNKNA